MRAGQILTVIFGRSDSPVNRHKPASQGRVPFAAAETPSQGVGKRPPRLDDDGFVVVAERHNDARTFGVEEDVLEVKMTAERKLRQPHFRFPNSAPEIASRQRPLAGSAPSGHHILSSPDGGQAPAVGRRWVSL